MDDVNGILLVDKPQGPTSHDVVDRVRRHFNLSKVGHAGTLDPAASGLLILLIGRSTKRSSHFLGEDKTYEGTLTLGVETETGDREGKVVREVPVQPIPLTKIQEVFQRFEGEHEQLPPMYSAVKVRGRKLYQFARKGIPVQRQSRRIHIHTLELKKVQLPELYFSLHCSKGTYVRSLAEEIGKVLGYPAILSQLRRIQSGALRVEEALPLTQLLSFRKDELRDHLRDEDESLSRSRTVS